MRQLNKIQDQTLRFIPDNPSTLSMIQKNTGIDQEILLDNLDVLYQMEFLRYHDKNNPINNFKENKW